jgi:hypothetical protein
LLWEIVWWLAGERNYVVVANDFIIIWSIIFNTFLFSNSQRPANRNPNPSKMLLGWFLFCGGLRSKAWNASSLLTYYIYVWARDLPSRPLARSTVDISNDTDKARTHVKSGNSRNRIASGEAHCRQSKVDEGDYHTIPYHTTSPPPLCSQSHPLGNAGNAFWGGRRKSLSLTKSRQPANHVIFAAHHARSADGHVLRALQAAPSCGIRLVSALLSALLSRFLCRAETGLRQGW